jgi:uncharacterized protein (DUF1778 family)
MNKGKRSTVVFQGVSRARRPKTGKNKGMLILLTREEKLRIEHAAAEAGVSMSRFIVERSLQAAGDVLSPPRKKMKETKS